MARLANEAELVSAAQAGKGEAFDVLMRAYYQSTFQVALGVVRNREDAEDVLQEAMLKAYSKLGQFQGNSQFYTWFFRIAMNEALMKVRGRHPDRQVMLDDVMKSERGYLRKEIEDWTNYPEKLYLQRELGSTLQQALAQLSPRLSATFRLCYIEQRSIKEIAKLLGMTTNGVKSRVSRARSRLKKKLRTLLRQAPRQPRSPAVPRLIAVAS